MKTHSLRIPIDTAIQIGHAKNIELTFDGMKFTWTNGSDEHYPEVLIPIEFQGFTYSWANSPELSTLNRFLSLVASRSHQPVQIHKFHRYVVRRDSTWEQLSRRTPPYVLDPADIQTDLRQSDRLSLALSLYREAISSSSVFYSFLCFYKILELGHDQYPANLRAAKIKEYMDDHIEDALANSSRTPQSLFLCPSTPTGDELYTAYRCAIAHASSAKMRSPDDVSDYYATLSRIDFIQALGIHLINSGHFANRTSPVA